MSNTIELARENARVFKYSAVGNTEILRDSVLLAEANPKLVAEKFFSYYHIVRDLFNLSGGELKTIREVNQKLGKNRGADEFLEAMGGQKAQILLGIRHMGDLTNPDNKEGMESLTAMMNNAREKKQADSNWVPRDGDPEADKVIWGFVKGSESAETDIDFALCHGIERALTAQLDPENNYIQHKDWLLIAMNDVVALKGLRGQGREAEVLALWSTPRPEGLGWISQSRLNAYKEAIGTDAK
jgi:hypothetical protein